MSSQVSESTRTDRVTVTMPPALLSELRRQVGGRGVSGYVQRAVARQLRSDALAAAIDDFETEAGAFTERELEEARARLDAARHA